MSVVLDSPPGDRWRMAPGDYRVIYRLSSGDIAGLVSGERVGVTLAGGTSKGGCDLSLVIASNKGNAPIQHG